MNNNMQQLLKRAQQLQEKLAATQKDLEIKEVTGTSGAGLISVIITLKGHVKSIVIDKSIINSEEKEMLEDLIVAAMNDAKNKADKKFEEGLKEASGGVDLSQMGGGLF